MKRLFIAIVILLFLMPNFVYAVDFHQVPMGKLKYFDTEDALRTWVAENKLGVVLIADKDGNIPLNNYPTDPRYDCDDYAEDLRRLAESQGYIIMLAPVAYGMIWGVEVIDIPGFHMGNWTMVGTIAYYVEPYPPKSRVVRIRDVD